ncbi:unnamed protein product [Xylocopa violacea]|uniref:Uncharacterized protein n=1 Tax=Xylocopa violacea TaxID=135666 RepID=A0ABP1N9V0_XYLVO
MQTSLPKQTVGCIGKCTSGLTADELDQITDNIHKTLEHQEGRKIFKKYLYRRDLRDNIECLELYEMCSAIVEEMTELSQTERESSLESLIENVKQVKEMAEFLFGVQLIDQDLLDRFAEALKNPTSVSLLGLLEETRDRCCDHLSCIHKSFKHYASEPCPMNK